MRAQLPWEAPKESFIAAVREGAVPHPAQRSFSQKKWEAAFAEFSEPSVADRRLFQSGSYFNLRFREVRDALAQSAPSRFPASDRIRFLVGYENYLLLATEKELSPDEDSHGPIEGARQKEAMHRFLKWADHHVVSLVDGLRFPLAEQWRIQSASNSPRLSPEKEVSDLSRTARLGQLYDALEDAWNLCLWRGWYYGMLNEHPVIAAADMALENMKAVGDFRHVQLGFEARVVSHEAWEKAPASVRHSILSQPRVVGISKSGKKKRLLIGTGLESGEPTTADFVHFQALDDYTDDLAKRQSDRLNGLAVADLLAAWYVLSPLSHLLFDGAHVPEVVNSPVTLKHLSPSVPIVEVRRVLSAALGFTDKQSALVTEMFTFADDHRVDPWTRPFIDLGGGEVTILRPVLADSNLNRLATRWIRDAGFSLDERGPKWEDEVRRSVFEGNKLPNAQILTKSFEFRTSVGVEEIDFLARIGQSVLVGEAKCSLLPTSGHDYARFITVLADAAEQAARKAKAILGEVTAFLDQVEWDVDEPLTAIPLVITNQAVGVGYQFGNVPVVDRLILERYFNEGELQQGVLRSGTKIVSTAKTIRFYTNAVEAETNIGSYLSEPPQLAVPRGSIVTEGLPLPPVSASSLGCHVLVRKVSSSPIWIGGDKPEWMQDNPAITPPREILEGDTEDGKN